MNSPRFAPSSVTGSGFSGPIRMNDVAAAFAALPALGRRDYYDCPTAPTGLTAMPASHFKGVATCGDRRIFTHTDLDWPIPAASGKYLVAGPCPAGGVGMIDLIADTAHAGWDHPCGMQSCGTLLAMGIQKAAHGCGASHSEVQIYDMAGIPGGGPLTLLTTFTQPSDGVNGVGMTREAGSDGRYLVATVNGKILRVYRSATGVPDDFRELLVDENFPDSGAGLGLITQTDDRIFLISMNANDDGSGSRAALYRLDLDQPAPSCVAVNSRALPIHDSSDSITLLAAYIAALPEIGRGLAAALAPLWALINTSFRWGRGLAVTSPDTFELYATDRNVLMLSRIPAIRSHRDFSVMVWATGGAAVTNR